MDITLIALVAVTYGRASGEIFRIVNCTSEFQSFMEALEAIIQHQTKQYPGSAEIQAAFLGLDPCSNTDMRRRALGISRVANERSPLPIVL